MSINQSIEKFKNYKNQEIQNIEALIVDLIKTLQHDHKKILEVLAELPDVNEELVIRLIDAHHLLLASPKVDDEVKTLLEDSSFVNENSTVLISLAKMFFYADKIELIENEIHIAKSLKIPEKLPEQQVPEIDVEKVISMILKKIKYGRLSEQNFEKIQELNDYDAYKPLHQLLTKAIERQVVIQKLKDDELAMSFDELKKFLDDE